MRRLGQRSMREPVPVDRAVGPRRIRPCRDQRLGKDAPSRRADRNDLDAGPHRQAVPQPRQSRVHRHPVDAGRQRETIVPERRRGGHGRRPERLLEPRAEDPALLGLDRVPRIASDLRREKRVQHAVRIERREGSGQKPHLDLVLHALRIRRGAHRLREQRGIDLREDQRGSGRPQAPIKRPDLDRCGQTRIAPQLLQRRDAEQSLPPDRPRAVELPAALGPFRTGFHAAELRKARARALRFPLGHRRRNTTRPAPERAAAEAGVDVRRDLEPVVHVVGGVHDAFGQMLPDREAARLTGQTRGESGGIAERKVETDQRSAPLREFQRAEIADPTECLGTRPDVLRNARHAVAGDADPDRVGGGPGRRRRAPRGPVDDQDRVEPHARPTRRRMKSAMPRTSSRSKTGTARPSSGASEATASIVASSSAIRFCAVAARRASILGCRSRL